MLAGCRKCRDRQNDWVKSREKTEFTALDERSSRVSTQLSRTRHFLDNPLEIAESFGDAAGADAQQLERVGAAERASVVARGEHDAIALGEQSQ